MALFPFTVNFWIYSVLYVIEKETSLQVFAFLIASEGRLQRLVTFQKFSIHNNSYNLRNIDTLSVSKVKTTSYGIKSISILGPKIWNSLPNEIKSSKNASKFKVLMKDLYFENRCACNACSQ